jgi:hypothetical protein
MFRNLLIRAFAVVTITLLLLSATEGFLRVQSFVQLNHFHDRNPWNKILHHGSGHFVVKNYGSNCEGKTTKLLLLGDSWMEDEGLSSAIGHELADKTKTCVQTINGGNSSYAPTVYLLRGRQAFELYGKFDAIVVNIDETDIGDEWLRYKIPTVRDAKGRISAVPYANDIAAQYLWNGKLWAEDSPLYIFRLLKFAYFYKILAPSIYKFTESPDLYQNLMQYVFAPEADSLYPEEQQYFDDRLQEMVEEISEYSSGPHTVYLSHHPHLRGLVDHVDDGHLYLPIVSEALARLGEKTGVRILDARKHIQQIHGDALLTDTFEEGDPFSHLSVGGATRYGKWIADQIEL